MNNLMKSILYPEYSKKFAYEYCLKNNIPIINQNYLTSQEELKGRHYLFYVEISTNNNCNIIHIKNMLDDRISKMNLHFCQFYPTSTSQHLDSIYYCGGYKGSQTSGQYLNDCTTIILSKMEISNHLKLNEIKSSVSLLSTPKILFCLGGWRNQVLKSCEILINGKNKWELTCSLNDSNFEITSAYINKGYIYAFGGSSRSLVERLKLMKGSFLLFDDPKWERLDISNTFKRAYGCTFMISNSAFLMFGGSYKDKSISIFDHESKEIIKVGKDSNGYQFGSSNPIIWKDSLNVVGTDEDKEIQYKIITMNLFDFSLQEKLCNF